MELDLTNVADTVRDSLNSYVVPDRPVVAVGVPLSAEWYAAVWAVMRASLVPPYWIQIRDRHPQSGKLVVLRVAVVAEDRNGFLVASDPSEEDDFVLARREPDPDLARGVHAVSCGVRGDAVGCFLSR